MDGLLHLRGTPAANWNLLLQVAMGAALLAGMGLARRRQFGWHRACQTTVVLLEVVLIAWVMAPSFHDQGVLSHALAHPRNTYYLVALVHAVLGIAGAGLGLYVVLSAGTPLLPATLRLRNFKLWMRTTLAIWLVALGLGLATFRVWYPPVTPAPAATLHAATTPSPAPPAANQEVVVTLTNFKFTPDKVTVAAGATVTWLDDTGRHSVRCDEEAFQSEPLVSGQRFAHRFDRPGTYQVYCGVHGRNVMAGTVAVEPR
jgi:plastocyanin/uncharacterized membrane protein YozB (DUF420 family)